MAGAALFIGRTRVKEWKTGGSGCRCWHQHGRDDGQGSDCGDTNLAFGTNLTRGRWKREYVG